MEEIFNNAIHKINNWAMFENMADIWIEILHADKPGTKKQKDIERFLEANSDGIGLTELIGDYSVVDLAEYILTYINDN